MRFPSALVSGGQDLLQRARQLVHPEGFAQIGVHPQCFGPLCCKRLAKPGVHDHRLLRPAAQALPG